MFDSGIHCAIGLLLVSVVLFFLVRKLSSKPSQDSSPESPSRAKRSADSKAGIVAQVLMSLILVVSIGAITGTVIWTAIQGLVGTITTSPEVFVAAIVGAAASAIGFGLFAVLLSLFGPILSAAYEEWTAYIAPTIGGTVGAAISSGLAINVIYLVPLSALAGGIALLFYRVITARERITFNAISELMIAGVGFGAINGIILAIVFKVLEVTAGTGWMLAG
jgi:hypothetical protein